MPGLVKPMLAKLIDKPFNSDEWVFELKWDGYRALANIRKGNVELYSRNGIHFQRYDAINSALEKLSFDAVLDGEIVAFDEQGIPKFQYLQNYESDPTRTLQYNVFDIIWYNGYDLKNVPLINRKELLSQIIPPNNVIIYSDHIKGDGTYFFEEVRKKGLEGIVGKLSNSPYRPGKRTGEWVKIKTSQRQEAIICGYTEPKGGRKFFGSLVLGVHDNEQKLKWIGSSGGGFDSKSLESIYSDLQKIRRDSSPFGYKIPQKSKVYWVEPKLVCEVSFIEWTHDGSMRHPVFMGMRTDKKPKDVKREIESPTKDTVEKVEETEKKPARTKSKKGMDKKVKINGVDLSLSHLDKVLWPDDGITKGDLIEYYRAMHTYILPHLKGRPESQNRYPNGIKEMSFFKKNMEKPPEWAETLPIKSDSRGEVVNYLICKNEATLVYMANLACIEMHPWNSKIGSLDNPDWIVIDIDPGENNTFGQVIETAQVVRSVLDKAKITAYPKTSGATGIHVYIPMGAKYTYEEGKTFANVIAEMTQAQLPDITTTVRNTKLRGDKIYVDYLQNNKGQTLASVYSVRPKPGATVSMPLKWEQVKKGLSPSDFTIKNVPKLIKKSGDIFKGVLGKGIDMEKCLKLLGE